MFAGAAREAVFANPDVIRRVNAEFVPVALKAGLVNNPPPGDEGRLYRELARSMPAPQGIGVANPAGKVLSWSLMFEDDASVLAFLDHTRERFRAFPDAAKPVPAERFMRFPAQKREDAPDTRAELKLPEGHPAGADCPATPTPPAGTLDVRLYGRALGDDGQPVADTSRQESYSEDRFSIDPDVQSALTRTLAEAGDAPFTLPEALTRSLMGHAYLGMLDVNPLDFGGKVKAAEIRGTKAGTDADGTTWIRLDGKTEVAGGDAPGRGKGDGRSWEHDIALTWRGLIGISHDRITQLLVLADGTEHLKWGNATFGGDGTPDVSRLPAGRPIDQTTKVRYGFVGIPVAGGRPADAAHAPAADRATRDRLIELIAGPALLFDDGIRRDLKLTEAQAGQLDRLYAGLAARMNTFLAEMQRADPAARGPEVDRFRQEVRRELDGVVGDVLSKEQRTRLRQRELQRVGPFAIFGDPEVAAELKLTDPQRQRLMKTIRTFQEQVQDVTRQAQQHGDANAARRRLDDLRREAAGTIEAELTDDQRRRWQDLLGPPPSESPQ